MFEIFYNSAGNGQLERLKIRLNMFCLVQFGSVFDSILMRNRKIIEQNSNDRSMKIAFLSQKFNEFKNDLKLQKAQ